MISYIIHCSLIWAIALLVYELWLRRTTFHGANRWYLNASLALGLLLPLYQPATPRPDVVPGLALPMRELALQEQRLQVISEQAGAEFNLGLILLLICSAGAAIQLLRLIREGFFLLRLRRVAVRTALSGCDVFITSKPHGPFSAFGSVYLSGTDAYSEDELRFILAHEQAHIRLRHSIDKCAVLLLRCLFWWHPLVYVYYSRLSLVQEFQADAPLRKQSSDYSRFLIDESLAVNGVSITHQFFHSPLKTRIRMLQRFATRNWQKAGYFAALALLAGGSFLWTNKSLAHKEEKQGNMIIFNGNRFETGVPPLKTTDGREMLLGSDAVIEVAEVLPAKDPAPGATATPEDQRLTKNPAPRLGTPFKVTLNAIPMKMNGEPIYKSDALDRQAALPDGTALDQTLITDYMPSLAKLPDGRYTLSLDQVIADTRGKLVYYKTGPVSWLVLPLKGNHTMEEDSKHMDAEKTAHPIGDALQARLRAEMESGLASLRLNPAQKAGNAVIGYVTVRDRGTMYVAEVANGKVRAVNINAR